MLGDGRIEVVKISLGPRKIRNVRARLNIFSSGLVVFQEGEWYGKIGVPYWENQLFHKVAWMALNQRRDFWYRPDELIFQVLPDTYTALRQTLHILYGNYGRTFHFGEKKALQQALVASQRLNDHLLGLRQETVAKLYRRMQREAEKIIAHVGTQPRDEKKREVLDLAAFIGEVVDTKGRVNPSAKLTQLRALERRLEARLKIIMAVEPKVVARRQAFLSIIELCELRFKSADDFLNRLLPRLNYQYFSQYDGLTHKVAVRLQHLADEIEEIDLQPFTFPAQEITREFRRAAELITIGKFLEAKVYLGISRESLTLRVIRTDIENFITFLTQLMFHPNRTLLEAEIRRIRNGFKNIKGRLRAVDETGFKRPVCQQALELIIAASRRVRRGKIRLLEPVKRDLVESARLL